VIDAEEDGEPIAEDEVEAEARRSRASARSRRSRRTPPRARRTPRARRAKAARAATRWAVMAYDAGAGDATGSARRGPRGRATHP